jgi:hypothetical protein
MGMKASIRSSKENQPRQNLIRAAIWLAEGISISRLYFTFGVKSSSYLENNNLIRRATYSEEARASIRDLVAAIESRPERSIRLSESIDIDTGLGSDKRQQHG